MPGEHVHALEVHLLLMQLDGVFAEQTFFFSPCMRRVFCTMAQPYPAPTEYRLLAQEADPPILREDHVGVPVQVDSDT